MRIFKISQFFVIRNEYSKEKMWKNQRAAATSADKFKKMK